MVDALLKIWFSADAATRNPPAVDYVRSTLSRADGEGYALACEALARAAPGHDLLITSGGVSVGDGKVYTLASGSRVVALDKNTGAQVWVVQPRGPGNTSLGNIAKVATVYHDGMVYVGTNDGNRGAAFALKSSDGSIVWSFYGTGDHGILTDVNSKTRAVQPPPVCSSVIPRRA